MAAIMETDTGLWLHNKLGSSDNQWSTGGIASQFNKTVLQNVYDCFVQLDTKSKIKLLLSFLEIPLRNMAELQDCLNAICELADRDNDEWVRVVSNIVKDYPQHHVIDKSLGKVATSFQETVEEVVNEVEQFQSVNIMNMLPLECVYLNRTVLNRVIPNPPAAVKHFTLRRKPKSAALRAKITQKASDAANQRRMSHSSASASGKVGLKRTNSVPSKVHSVTHNKASLSKTSALPKKTKLLDITEQPLGAREQKKRKKMMALEASLEEARQRKLASDSKGKKSQDRQDDQIQKDSGETETDTEQEGDDVNVTDESAENLEMKSESDAENPTKTEATPTPVSQTPSYAVMPGTSSAVSTSSNQSESSKSKVKNSEQKPSIRHANAVQSSTESAKRMPPSDHRLVNVDPAASYNTQNLQRELQMRVQQEQDRIHQQHQLNQQRFNQHMLQQQHLHRFQQHQQFAHGANMTFGAPGMGLSHQLPPPLQAPLPSAMDMHAPTLPPQQKKGLSLTREQMYAAQEMFRSANRVTRAEKALILGFMAGARDNPFPQQGPVITIKLSEATEEVHQPDTGRQTVLIEMLFEMNYETGHWRRLKRTRVVS